MALLAKTDINCFNDIEAMTPYINQFKRVMLLVIILLSLLSTIAGWAVMGAQGVLTPALNSVQGVTTLVLSSLLVAAWWKLLSQRLIERACLLFAVLVCTACMALGMYWPQQYGAGIQLQPLYLWIPIIYVFAFTLTDHRTGLVIALGILLLLVGVSVPYLLRGSRATYGNYTLQLHFVSAVLIAALYYFSSYQHRLGAIQSTVDQLAQLSNTDEVTQLSNRRHMAALIMSELTHCANHGGTFALVLFDIDRFKAINDEFGHSAGDQALKALAASAARTFRDIDSLGRWGGDEFVALARNVDVVAAKAMAETLRCGIAAEPLLDHSRITISCGVTVVQADDNIDSLLQRADVALYAAKRGGRNRVEGVFS